MKEVLILLGSASDLKITEKGVDLLKKMHVSFQLRVASAHRTPEYLHQIVNEFDQQEGKVVVCVAGKSAHLGGVVASITTKPVLGVPVFTPETAGFDALLSMCQMPGGIPVATMGIGSAGFTNACLQAVAIMALSSKEKASALKEYRDFMKKNVIESDLQNRQDF